MFSISSFPRWPKIFFGCSQALPSWQGWASLLPFFPSHPSRLQKVQTLVAKWWISVCDISHFLQLCPWRKGPSSRFLLGAAWEPWKRYRNEKIWQSLLKNGAPRDEAGLQMSVALAFSCWQHCPCSATAAPELGGTRGTGVTSRAEGSMAREQRLKGGYWNVKLALLPEVFLENPGPGVTVNPAVFGGRALFCKKSIRVSPECDTWWIFCFWKAGLIGVFHVHTQI